ncbi:5-formyltetrahydrofolate cyclo-ligase [Salaquimonas pukyongi]|uniref:5-formyltetrahydrofolate cyclo-ligase n=1 Tax=Salaquimonas pukyongi TaxID=2712698 RepID=UPI00096BAC89|nr:5-formyltetrahydrofolate cyclo-ligase [Salaquimonas pukyongi]
MPSSSPPCFAHELAENADGSFCVVDEQQRLDVMRWRKAERQRLIEARRALSATLRQQMSDAISQSLMTALGEIGAQVISFYWPFRGEPDLRPLMEQLSAKGAVCSLPIVVEKGKPLSFKSWRQGEKLDRGVWNIPVPAGGETVTPDIVVAPVVGFDPSCFRLGYGGGFFDRTLASMGKKPRLFGVGYASQNLATIYPQPHDIPMDCIITEAGVVQPQAHCGQNPAS